MSSRLPWVYSKTSLTKRKEREKRKGKETLALIFNCVTVGALKSDGLEIKFQLSH